MGTGHVPFPGLENGSWVQRSAIQQTQSEIGWNITENYGWWAVPTLQQLSRSQTVAKALIGETYGGIIITF
jgi:hypothetical protein